MRVTAIQVRTIARLLDAEEDTAAFYLQADEEGVAIIEMNPVTAEFKVSPRWVVAQDGSGFAPGTLDGPLHFATHDKA